ncbi:hypothetical protein FHW58_001098 [Duganella sp. 1224]|uniref:hypothetical protein n=1 Tax=Duganella sp. 1224 TaxID=2587052 RepID=UPI0015C9C2B9|nr:hypothetical protein [Duganella sp. 1224]NYE59946.1 hypothetical protein [Duganella sp. 1224]
MDMVSRLPGFVFDGGNVGRGVPGNVLINGKRPTAKTDALGDVLGRIPAAAVERIEVINGGANGIDMLGYPTVANLLLKQMDLVSISTTASTSILPDGTLTPSLEGNYNLKRGDQNITVLLARSRSPDMAQGLGTRTTVFTGPTPAAQVRVAGAGVAENTAVKVGYGQGVLDGQLTWNGALTPWTYQSQASFDAATHSQTSNDNAGHTREQGLTYSRDLARGASLDLKALYRTSETSAESATINGADTSHAYTNTSATEQVLGGQVSWQAGDGVVIRGGLERAVNTNDTSASYQANAWVQESRVEGQLSSAWQVDNALSAEAGLKVAHSILTVGADQPEAKGHLYPKPRLRLSLSPLPSLQLRLRMEREVSQLNFGDAAAYFDPANKTIRGDYPDLVAAKTWLCEGAIEYKFWERGTAVLSYTQSHISDAIDRMPVRTAASTYDVAGNIGDASADSVTGLLNLPTDNLALPQGLLKLSTTWRSSSVTDPVTQATRRLSGETPLSWRVEFSQDLPQQRTNWGISVDNGWSNDSWQVAERDSSSGSGWARAFVNYKPQPNLVLTLELNNLAGRTISYDRTHYAGDRLASVDFVEHNITRTQPYAMLRLRRDW